MVAPVTLVRGSAAGLTGGCGWRSRLEMHEVSWRFAPVEAADEAHPRPTARRSKMPKTGLRLEDRPRCAPARRLPAAYRALDQVALYGCPGSCCPRRYPKLPVYRAQVLAYRTGTEVEPLCHLRVCHSLGYEAQDLHFAL